MYRKICVTNRALAEHPFLEQLACVLATKPYAMILREKDLPAEDYKTLAITASVYRDAGRTKAEIFSARCLRTFGGGCASGRTMWGNLSDGRACVCDRL